MVDPIVTSRFDDIYEETYRTVLRFVTAKCGNTADIEDIMQETYVDLFQLLLKRGPAFIENEQAMVLAIAKQKVYRHYSLKDRLKLFLPMTTVTHNDEEINLIDLEADPFPEEEFNLQQIRLDEARAWIRKKPQDVKKVFYLFYDQDLTIKEIAVLLSMSESNVKHKLYRTLKELRTLFR